MRARTYRRASGCVVHQALDSASLLAFDLFTLFSTRSRFDHIGIYIYLSVMSQMRSIALTFNSGHLCLQEFLATNSKEFFQQGSITRIGLIDTENNISNYWNGTEKREIKIAG
jgi:hypothetical protein